MTFEPIGRAIDVVDEQTGRDMSSIRRTSWGDEVDTSASEVVALSCQKVNRRLWPDQPHAMLVPLVEWVGKRSGVISQESRW